MIKALYIPAIFFPLIFLFFCASCDEQKWKMFGSFNKQQWCVLCYIICAKVRYRNLVRYEEVALMRRSSPPYAVLILSKIITSDNWLRIDASSEHVFLMYCTVVYRHSRGKWGKRVISLFLLDFFRIQAMFEIFAIFGFIFVLFVDWLILHMIAWLHDCMIALTRLVASFSNITYCTLYTWLCVCACIHAYSF